MDEYEQRNPFIDPQRGRIINVQSNEGTGVIDGIYYNFLQNLSGYESIIGRSISVYSCKQGDYCRLQGCCVVATDNAPFEKYDSVVL